MAETIEELRRMAAEAEERGDWRLARDAKRRWFALIHAAANVDGRTPAEQSALDERMKGFTARADKPAT
jgi:hypothetical protein